MQTPLPNHQIIKSLSVAPTTPTAPITLTTLTTPITLTALTAPTTLTFPDCPLQGLIAKSSHRQIIYESHFLSVYHYKSAVLFPCFFGSCVLQGMSISNGKIF